MYWDGFILTININRLLFHEKPKSEALIVESVKLDFTAFAISGEIDLNRLASELGISGKYRWEEPMILCPEKLRPISDYPPERKRVFLYFFGGIVFINSSEKDIDDFFTNVEKFSDEIKDHRNILFRDNYSLDIEAGAKPSITNDYALMTEYDPAFADIICFVIAKSVALERIEEQVENVLDEMEIFMGRLGRGKLGMPDKRLARLASKILSFKYHSISHIMVLDKPDVTWNNQETDRLYLTMANLFELNQRYTEIRHKSETLMDITEVFSTLSHARREARLELAIIILIVIEIIIYIAEILLKSS
jgi:uncharacterized Rmd1/YagE family protein